eukprot:g8020.t1
MPTEAEQMLLQEAPAAKLLPVEAKLVPFCRIPKLHFRLRVLAFLKKQSWQHVSQKLQCFGEVATVLKKSANVRQIKSWMEQRESECVWGISVESLQKLADFKGNQEKTLLHGIAACCEKSAASTSSDTEKENLLTAIGNELRHAMKESWVKKLGKPVLADVVQDFLALLREIEFVKTQTMYEKKPTANESAESLNIYSSPLFEAARSQVAELDRTVLVGHRRCLGAVVDLCAYLGCQGPYYEATAGAAPAASPVAPQVTSPTTAPCSMKKVFESAKLMGTSTKQIQEMSEQVQSIFATFFELAFVFTEKLADEEAAEVQAQKRQSAAEFMKLRKMNSVSATAPGAPPAGGVKPARGLTNRGGGGASSSSNAGFGAASASTEPNFGPASRASAMDSMGEASTYANKIALNVALTDCAGK